MSVTRALAGNLSRIRYDDLPSAVVEKSKLLILDTMGNSVGGYPLDLSRVFVDMSTRLGSSSQEATLIGDGTKVSVPMAAFGNGALSTMLDFIARYGTLAVPAALAAGEYRGISGREFITSVVAGYECLERINRSMEMTDEQQERLGVVSPPVTYANLSVFAAAAGAGRALGLDEDQMLSTLGMAGIYQPVPSGYKWIGDEGLLPRKDIKQGWAWMSMSGAFAAVSAESGLKMLQENNILDGERGLWRMLGMDIFRPEEITSGFGKTFHILDFRSKLWPGCMVTHTAMSATISLVQEHHIVLDDVESIGVATQKSDGVGFHDQKPVGLCDQQFSVPYQVAASLYAGERGPNWYTDEIAKSPEIEKMSRRVTLSFDDEADEVFLRTGNRMSEVTISTKAGRHYSKRLEEPDLVEAADEIRDKFLTTTAQVIAGGRAHRIVECVEHLEDLENVSDLTELCTVV